MKRLAVRIFLTPAACHGLPERPCVLGTSELLRALVRRASDWVLAEQLEPEQHRVCEVLLDELHRAPQESLHLPMPVDRRLLRRGRFREGATGED